MNFTPRITQQDIARRAGYDKSTVSLALSRSPRVSEKTRQFIVRIAEELGYRPDPAIVQLARHRWAGHEVGAGSVLAYVVERKLPPYALQRRHLAAVHARAEERGFHVEEFDLSEYPSGRAASRVLYHRGVRGLILPALPHGAEFDLASMEWDKFTVVGCSLGWSRGACHVVAPDAFEGTRRAWREVAARGYRRIGAALFRHSPVAVEDHTRLGASHVEQAALPADHARLPFHLGDPEDRVGFMTWFRRHRPDVVIGLVGRACDWLEAEGYAVPRDVAYAALNVAPGAQYSGASVQFDEVGRRAVDFLLAEMRDNRWGLPESPEMLLLAPRWLEGVTLPDLGATTSSSEGRAGTPFPAARAG